MRHTFAIILLGVAFTAGGSAHPSSGAPTWNREVSRIIYDRCASCHRPAGTAFSLLTYQDVQPRANEIKDAVLSRQMPPWGAVKGFGQFRNDQSLSQEQIEVLTRWVDGGIRRGNNPNQLPATPTFAAERPFSVPIGAVNVRGTTTLSKAMVLDGLLPVDIPAGTSARVTATIPGGSVAPLVWLHAWEPRFAHPFLFRSPRTLPAGTVIRGVPDNGVLALLPRASDK